MSLTDLSALRIAREANRLVDTTVADQHQRVMVAALALAERLSDGSDEIESVVMATEDIFCSLKAVTVKLLTERLRTRVPVSHG